ncbi:hypothetical protein M6B38_347560 [Iris pallida]|uniref:Uncharacterized protein n=1 Tax=Iris pallida TaxID=29817 RepID=A0AAX6GS85_IRIPA|nr:hypothetical protein M6B38_227935 [Iris pallida]KAJ6831609.1 hypothetical protein M6B38_347560 [Iris pallida]
MRPTMAGGHHSTTPRWSHLFRTTTTTASSCSADLLYDGPRRWRPLASGGIQWPHPCRRQPEP